MRVVTVAIHGLARKIFSIMTQFFFNIRQLSVKLIVLYRAGARKSIISTPPRTFLSFVNLSDILYPFFFYESYDIKKPKPIQSDRANKKPPQLRWLVCFIWF